MDQEKNGSETLNQGEPEWFDEEEPHEPQEQQEPEWFDEDQPEVDEVTLDPMDEEGDDLADMLADEMKNEPATGEDWEADYEESPEQESPEQESLDADYDEPPAGEDSDGGDGEEIGEEEPQGAWRRHRKLWITLIIIAAAVVAAYLAVGFYFRSHFEPNTTIGGVECDYMTVDELEEALQAQISQYELQIDERGGEVETLYGSDFGIHAVYGNRLDNILEEQGAFKWPASFFREDNFYDPGKLVEWDEDEFLEDLDSLNCMDPDKMIDPEDAEILFSEEDGEFYIKPAEYGTHIDTAVMIEKVTDAVASLAGSIDLEEEGCYETPNVTESSEEMVSTCEEMNRMISADIVYDMIDIDDITISKEQLSEWITLDSNMEPSYNDEAIAAFVADFAEQYDTLGKEHTLHTSWGTTASVSVGTYGWQLNQEGEIAQLMEDLEAETYVRREPVWSHTAASHGENDYGNTYVEVNLTKQHLYYYKDGALVVDSDFVSGKMTYGRVTDEGIYYVYYKQTNAVLKGEDYETPVSYWMPFDGGEGLHDATWRGSFGGDIYMYNGSHGCINLPYSVAETIYNNINIGDCVFVYWDNGLTMSLQADPPTSTTTDTTTSGGTTAVTEDPTAKSTDTNADAGKKTDDSGNTSKDTSGDKSGGDTSSNGSGSGTTTEDTGSGTTTEDTGSGTTTEDTGGGNDDTKDGDE